MRSEVFQSHSVRVAGIAFQACLIDRSSISPFLESTTYEQFESDYRTRRSVPTCSTIFFAFSNLALGRRDRNRNCVGPLNVQRRLTAISLSCARLLAAYPRIADRIAEVQSDVMRCLRRRTFAAFQAQAVAKFYDRVVTNHVSRSVAHNLRAVFRLEA
jgi:hypothetical protein